MSALFDLEVEKPAPMERVTERHMLDLLHNRYGRRHAKANGNGPRFVIAEHVKSAAGFDALGSADAIVQDLWPSHGLELLGFEVKVSRSDWLSELRKPEKAERFAAHTHRWYLVAAHESIARPDEVTERGWGLLVKEGERLRQVIPAPRRDPLPMPPSMIAALLRATAKTASRLPVGGDQ